MKEGVRTPDERDGEMSSRPTSNRKLARTLNVAQCAPFCSLGLRICIRDFITPLKCKIKNQKNQIYYSILLFFCLSAPTWQVAGSDLKKQGGKRNKSICFSRPALKALKQNYQREQVKQQVKQM